MKRRDALVQNSATDLGNDDNMIPLINIVFLLLIFFMVAGQISQLHGDVDLPLTQTDKAVKTDMQHLRIEADGKVYFQDQLINVDDLLLDLSPALWPSADQGIAIQGDKDLSAKALSPVLKALRAQGFSNIALYAKQEL